MKWESFSLWVRFIRTAHVTHYIEENREHLYTEEERPGNQRFKISGPNTGEKRKMVNLDKLSTEKVNPKSVNFSSMSIEDSVTLMNEEDLNTVKAVAAAKNEIVKVITGSSKTLKNGGRLIYIGAGTSGRLGLLDAVECPPTFGVDYETVIGLIAGGEKAFVKAKEGSEDSKELAVEDLKNVNLTDKDMVIGVAASGRTPYVIGGLEYAKTVGCPIGAVVCSADSEIAEICPNTVALINGPEVLTGSTRLKSGTATKMVLNMISTISMKEAGKVYKNYMVDVKLTNKKLEARGLNIVKSVTGKLEDEAKAALDAAGNEVKTAIVMLEKGVDADQARTLLKEADGYIDRIPA